ncbi:MAG: hypothetical protein IJ786_03625 [Bacteroidaceae bacterium]|nr:hypothetical protein [Bacteroidaceae bacterium]
MEKFSTEQPQPQSPEDMGLMAQHTIDDSQTLYENIPQVVKPSTSTVLSDFKGNIQSDMEGLIRKADQSANRLLNKASHVDSLLAGFERFIKDFIKDMKELFHL